MLLQNTFNRLFQAYGRLIIQTKLWEHVAGEVRHHNLVSKELIQVHSEEIKLMF